jgi:aspartate/glutamate racemase
MAMADTATTAGSPGAPVTQLKSLVDQLVTVTTGQGEVTGVVLSCTRLSVWLVVDDDDVVVALRDITALHQHASRAAA